MFAAAGASRAFRVARLAPLGFVPSVAAQTTQSQFAPFATDDGALRAQAVFEGLEHPWSIAFLPGRQMLITERTGRMRLMRRTDRRIEFVAFVEALPAVQVAGQGGLLDVIASPEFATDETIYFCLAQPTDRGARTAIFRARLQSSTLREVEMIFAQKHDPSGRLHFGCRLVIGRDGFLYAGLGERYSEFRRAQSLDNHFGKVVRVRTDGGIPRDNPFVGQPGALPEIFSFGHRNPQGAALHPASGALWMHEHGPQGGDELNIIAAGRNYGWPIITHGREYVTNSRIGEGTARSDVQASVHYWIPSIAPSGLCFLSPAWSERLRAQVLIGALKERCLVALRLQGDRVVGEQRLLTGLGARVRDVREAPDGALFILADDQRGALIQLVA
jgi:glucose/arabinose dehydrogenase